MDGQEQIRIGVVLERHSIDSPWQPYAWRTVAVVPGASGFKEWKEMASGPRWTHYYAANLPLTLYRKETEGYRINLSQPIPSLYVVLKDINDERPKPFLVTACPFEAGDYEISGDERADKVPMPNEILSLVGHFIKTHHIQEPFTKRQRKAHVSVEKIPPESSTRR